MWLIAAGVGLALVAALIAFFVVEAPGDQQRARSQAAAEQLAGWVRQTGFEPTEIAGDIDPASETAATSDGSARLAPRVQVAPEQLPITIRWGPAPPAGTQADGSDQVDVGDRTVEIGDTTQREGRAYAWFDCGPTSVHVVVDMPLAVDAEDLPPDGGHDAVMDIATGLVAVVPCPVDHPAEPAD